MSGFGLSGYGFGGIWGSISAASLVIDRALGDFEFSAIALSEGYSIRVRYSAPSSSDAPTWSRRLRILRKQGEWPQSWDDSGASVCLDAIFPTEGSFYFDETGLNAGQTYYYALFTLRNDGNWIHDPFTQQDWAYPYDRWGASGYMYDSLPRGFRTADIETGNQLEQFVSIFGALVDNIKTDIEWLLTLFEIETIHDDLLYLLDDKIGWPTWHQTGALQRRKETSEAVDLYKLFGRAVAYEQMLSEISDWDVEVFEGSSYVFFTNGIFGSTTPDFTDPLLLTKYGTLGDYLHYTPSRDWWQNLHGLVIRMTEIPGVSGPLTEIMLDRARQLIEFGKVSYAYVHLLAVTIVEELVYVPLEEWYDPVMTWTEGVFPVPTETDLGATTGDAALFMTNLATSTTNSLDDRLFHEALEYV